MDVSPIRNKKMRITILLKEQNTKHKTYRQIITVMNQKHENRH